jgi:hypothetical protein
MTNADVVQIRSLQRRDVLRTLVGATLCAQALPTLACDSVLRPMDLMPSFWTAYDATMANPMAVRVDALIERFFKPHATQYKQAGLKWSADIVAQWLSPFDAFAPSVRKLHQDFAKRLAITGKAFRSELTDFQPIRTPIVVLPSLFQFDGHMELAGDQWPLSFGLDGIVLIHGADPNLEVLISHELFHCYQAECNPSLMSKPKLTVGENLWIEGTATYASERLNPLASLSNVLCDTPALVAMPADTLRKVALAAIAQFDSDDDATLAQYFDLGYRGSWAARAGYYVGLLAARTVGKHMSLKEIASTDEAQFRPLLLDALKQISSSGERPT